MSASAHFDRGSVSMNVRHGKCQACHCSALGVQVEGGSIPSTDWVFVCLRCLVDACVDLLPELAREFVRWKHERRARDRSR